MSANVPKPGLVPEASLPILLPICNWAVAWSGMNKSENNNKINNTKDEGFIGDDYRSGQQNKQRKGKIQAKDICLFLPHFLHSIPVFGYAGADKPGSFTKKKMSGPVIRILLKHPLK